MSRQSTQPFFESTYRPLNVRDALTYLDQVKVQFQDQPEVYNRFLDVMKEFKGQIIDTPGVIDRVSNLFAGHPALIQGFNTFLPPGYRIECTVGEGDKQGLITVTTPSGTVSQVQGQGGLAAAINDSRQAVARRAVSPTKRSGASSLAPQPSKYSTNSYPSSSRPGTSAISTTTPARTTNASALGSIQMPSSIPLPASGPSTPSAAQFLAQSMESQSQQIAGSRMQGVEFNHAISFVNKIKNRYDNDPETYKQFLEVLQTYQRDQREIAEVYAQVTTLFHNAPDLIEEFKQFLPESGSGAFGFGSFVQAAQQAPGGPQEKLPVPVKRGSRDVSKDQKGKRKGAESGKSGQRSRAKPRAETPSDGDGPTTLPLHPQTLATAEEVAFFDKVKKFIDDKVAYHEFLKLVNLFVQDTINAQSLVERAATFIGDAGDLFTTFKEMMGVDDDGHAPTTDPAQGGMIKADSLLVENTPMLERPKPDLSGPKVKSYGPSYRRLPKSEINLQCTGRDAMCWEVLNDKWVSHPTWAAEDAAPFMAHKKNAYEEALHKSEEERHEYDYHIEANLRTINLLEPIAGKILVMSPEDRAQFTLKSGLGGQSKSIYQRIIKKVYGKELGPEVIRALHDNPVVAVPIVLDRLKAKDEEWKKAQREWNRVWREQDAKNFYKALDHQGVAFKNNDKRILAPKSLIAEIEARKREVTSVRRVSKVIRISPHFRFDFADIEVVKDVMKLLISYLDRIGNNLTSSDKDRIERQIRDFIPLLLNLDKDEFDAEFGVANHTPDDDEASETSSVADEDESSSVATGTGATKRKGKGAPAGDLRKKLLKSVQEGRQRAGTSTPGPEDHDEPDMNGGTETPATERAETPVPMPADPEAVAKAVEKDKAVAEAGEQVWVNIEKPEQSESSQASGMDVDGAIEPDEKKEKSHRKLFFFANNNFYVLVRLIQVIYSRLLLCKTHAAELAAAHTQPINPLAIELGLAEPDTQYMQIEAGSNPAQKYYGHLLGMSERLFEGDVEINTYEETMRIMFGTKAYVLFTLDKVISSIVKQLQTIVGDMKSQELFALLQRDRQSQRTTIRQSIAYRMQAEGVVGVDDNLFKIEYIPDAFAVTVQLLGRQDLTVDDADDAQHRWLHYVDSYVLTHPTEGISTKVDPPFMQRSLEEDGPDEADFVTTSGLDVRIALGNYKLFYDANTEDYFHRSRSAAELTEFDLQEKDQEASAKRWLDEYVANASKAEGTAIEEEKK